MPNSMTTRSSTYSPPDNPRGTPRIGRIVTLLTGKGHGFIRLPNAREVYFHRADLQAGTAFNDIRIGDAVCFELLEDAVSGARALRIARRATIA
jgi:cold shock CspA family protein